MERVVIMGKYRLFQAICQILNIYGTLAISHLTYIAIFLKGMLVSPGERSSRV